MDHHHRTGFGRARDHSSYVAIRNLTIDGKDNGGSFGVSAKGGTGNVVHHVRVERCTFVHHAGDQQQDAISTKTPTWGWEIRENRIINAGTGLYLGDSSGNWPFIRGVIERNLVQEPVGYCMEIKFQNPWPAVAGLPSGDGATVIRHNVFIKGDNACDPSLCRPNLLVGGFPDSGPGSNDRYEIYGNFFFHNLHESLLQASGRVSIHDNVFVDGSSNAVLLRDHDLPLKQAFVYNNTVFTSSPGLNFASVAAQGSLAVGNVVFSPTPIAGTPADARDNVTGAVADPRRSWARWTSTRRRESAAAPRSPWPPSSPIATTTGTSTERAKAASPSAAPTRVRAPTPAGRWPPT